LTEKNEALADEEVKHEVRKSSDERRKRKEDLQRRRKGCPGVGKKELYFCTW
jgi:hypothetical protein